MSMAWQALLWLWPSVRIEEIPIQLTALLEGDFQVVTCG